MGSPSRMYRTFVDADGVRWGVETRLLGEGTDAIAVSFAFTSHRGEHRTLDGPTPDCLSWEQFSDADWCQLLAATRVVRPAAPRPVWPRYYVASRSLRS